MAFGGCSNFQSGIRSGFLPDVVKMPVNISNAERIQLERNTRNRFMAEPIVSKHHSVASEVESVIHPPHTRMTPVVISANQNFSTQKIRVKTRHYPMMITTNLHIA